PFPVSGAPGPYLPRASHWHGDRRFRQRRAPPRRQRRRPPPQGLGVHLAGTIRSPDAPFCRRQLGAPCLYGGLHPPRFRIAAFDQKGHNRFGPSRLAASIVDQARPPRVLRTLPFSPHARPHPDQDRLEFALLLITAYLDIDAGLGDGAHATSNLKVAAQIE